MFVYTLLDANTSSSKITNILSMFFYNNPMPQRNTIESMAIKLRMSDMQVCFNYIMKLIYFCLCMCYNFLSFFKCSSVLYEVPNLTLWFDASTKEGVHFNVISITSTDFSYLFGLD